MKVGITTALVGFFGVVGIASADFMMIKIDLNQYQKLLTLGQGDPANPNDPPMPNPGGMGGLGPGPGGFIGKGPKGLPGPGPQPPPGAMPAEETTPLWVYACLELKVKPTLHKVFLEIEHPWGKHTLVPTPVIRYIQRDTVYQEYQKRLKKEQKDGKLLPGMLALAGWSLNHGLTKQFHDLMGEIRKEYPKDRAVAAYDKVQAALKKRPQEDDPGARPLMDELKREGYRPSVTEQGHYTLLSKMALNAENDVILKRYRGRLDETFENFFYWFAAQKEPVVVPVPTKRLAAVLVMKPSDFQKQHVVWGSPPMAADGFTPRRDNVMIISGQRTEEPFTILKDSNEKIWTSIKIGKDEFLSGTVWKRKEAFINPAHTALLQTLALVQKAMEEESERATITHEGARQLLAATGLLPRSIEAPEWVQSGIASFFDTPYGAFYAGMGLPSWSELISFKYYRKTGKLTKGPDVLYQVVTDRLFRQARQTAAQLADLKDDKSQLADKNREQREIARCTAWSFVYYLAHNQKLHYLKRYCEEVSNLPRDLEFDERALQGCFARAFQLSDSSDPNRLDPQKLQQLADDWFSQMDSVTLEIAEVEADALRARDAPKKTAPHPGGGG